LERGRIDLPRIDVHRNLCKLYGMRHIDFLVEIGILDWREVPGATPDAPPDLDLIHLIELLKQIDLRRDNRAKTLAGIFQVFRELDEERQPQTSSASSATGS
jgi:hypothetical protein